MYIFGVPHSKKPTENSFAKVLVNSPTLFVASPKANCGFLISSKKRIIFFLPNSPEKEEEGDFIMPN